MTWSIIQLKVPVSNSTSRAKRKLLYKMARLCHDTTCLPPFLTFAHIPCQTSVGERWRMLQSQVGVTFQGSPPVSRQWIRRPPRLRSSRPLKMWLAPNGSGDRTPALVDGVWSRCIFLLAEPQSSIIKETTRQILTVSRWVLVNLERLLNPVIWRPRNNVLFCLSTISQFLRALTFQMHFVSSTGDLNAPTPAIFKWECSCGCM